MSVLIVVLISSGLVIWEQYFSDYTTIEQNRIADRNGGLARGADLGHGSPHEPHGPRDDRKRLKRDGRRYSAGVAVLFSSFGLPLTSSRSHLR